MEKGRRTRRVGVVIQREIGNLIVREAKDPRLEGVTITHVDVSDDLSDARIFFFVPAGKDVKSVLRGFESARGYFRAELGDALKMRRTPELHFIYDDSLDLFEKIARIRKKEGE